MKRRITSSALLYGAATVCLLQLAAAGVAAFAKQRCVDQLAAESSRQLATTTAIDALRKELATWSAPEPERWQLAEVVDVSATLQVLQAAGDQAGITFSSLKAVLATTPGKQSFQVVGRGQPSELCAWLRQIEQQDRVLVIESGRLTPSGTDSIGFEIGIALYHGGGAQ